MRRSNIVSIAGGLALASAAVHGQGFYYNEVDAVTELATGALEFTLVVDGPLVSATTIGVAEADVAGSPQPEVLFHDATTIRYYDAATMPATLGTVQPSPPVPIAALVGFQLAGTSPQTDLIAVASNSLDLYTLDLAVPAPAWSGPFTLPPGITAVSMAVADAVGTAAVDLVVSDGTDVWAFDGATGLLTQLPTPPTPVDSISALDVGLNYFMGVTATFRFLSANGVGPTGAASYLFDRTIGSWINVPIPRRFRIASAAPFDRTPAPDLSIGQAVVPRSGASAIRLVDIAPGAGVFASTGKPGGDLHCPGAVFTDLNGDTFPDLYLARGNFAGGASTANQLFFGNGAGGFTPQTALGALDPGNGAGALALDYDNDGLMDLYAINMDGDNRLFQQQPGGTFVDVTALSDPSPADPPGDLQEGLRAGLPDLAGGGRCPPRPGNPSPGPQQPCELNDTLSAAAGDFNRDGLLDVYVGNHLCCGFAEGERDVLYVQGPVGVFTDVTVSAQITKPTVPAHDSSQSVIVDDFNNDQWPDIYVAVKLDGPPSDKLYLNDGPGPGGVWSGTFTEWFVGRPPLGDLSPGAMGVDAGDIDNDGDLDIFVSDLGPSMELYENLTGPAGGPFNLRQVAPNPMASPFWSWGVSWSDFDNDGDQDLSMAANDEFMDWLWRNDGGGVYVDVAFDAGVALIGPTRGNVPADFDRDGRVDLVVVNKLQPISLFHNRSAAGNWLGIQLIGNPSPPAGVPYTSTAGAVGARIDLTAGGVTQRRDITVGGITCGSTRDYVVHFGLGNNPSVAQVTISWPSGQTTILPNPQVPVIPINGVLTVTEP